MRRRALRVVLVAVAVVVVAGALASRLAARLLARELEARTGLAVTIGELSPSLLPPGLAARHVALRARGAAAPAIVARRVVVRAAWRSLLRGVVRFELVRLVEPRVRLRRAPDGHLGLHGLATAARRARAPAAPEPPRAETAATTADETARRPAVTVAALEIRNGRLRLEDRALAPPRTTGVVVPRLTARALIVAADGSLARLAWRGEVRRSTARGAMTGRYRSRGTGVDLRVRARLAGVALPELAPWLPLTDLRRGTLAGHVEHRWSTGDTPRNRLRATLRLRHVELGRDPRLVIADLHADGLRADLHGRRVRVERLALRRGSARCTTPLGSCARLARPDAGGGPPWEVVVDDAVLAGAALAAPGIPAMAVRAAHGRDLSSGWPSGEILVDAALDAGGTVRALGVVDPGGGWAWARAKVRDVGLAGVAHLPPPLEVTDGRLSGVATVSTPPLVLTDAALVVDRFGSRTRDAAGERPALAWHVARARASRIALDPLVLRVASLSLDYPYLVLRRLGAPGEAASPEPAPDDREHGPTRVPDLSIAALAVRDGTLFVEDRTVAPAYLGSLSGLALDGSGLRLEPPRVTRLDARGMLNELAPVTIAAREGDAGVHEVDARADGLPVPPLGAYLAHALGWIARRGDADVRATMDLGPSRLDASVHLVLRDLDVTPAGPDVIGPMVGVPLGVAVALMKDRRGELTLDIPLAGTPGAPTFAVEPLVVDATARAILGAIASPLTLLGAAFTPDRPGQPLAIEPIAFEPGSADLDPEAARRTDLLAVLLAQRPELRLTLQGRSGAVDLEATGDPAALPALARSRAAKLQQALTEGHAVEPDRIRLAADPGDGSPAVIVEPAS